MRRRGLSLGSTVAVVLALLAGALTLSACGSVDDRATLAGNLTLEQARLFAGFPLYYAGDRADGLPLTAVLRRNDTANYVSFVYGDCVPGALEQGCAPPAEIQVWPARARGLGSYESSAHGTPVAEKTAIRGVPAAFLGAGHLELYTARSTVVVFSGSRERVFAIASALRCLGAAHTVEVAGTLDC